MDALDDRHCRGGQRGDGTGRHVRSQRKPAIHCGKSFRLRRPSHLGADVASDCECGRPATFGLAGKLFRPPAPADPECSRFHSGEHLLRAGANAYNASYLPHPARSRGRLSSANLARDYARGVSSRRTRTSHGAMGRGIVIAPIVAPMLGGWLTTNHSWRWIFFVNLPVSVLGLFLVWNYVFDPPYIRRPW